MRILWIPFFCVFITPWRQLQSSWAGGNENGDIKIFLQKVKLQIEIENKISMMTFLWLKNIALFCQKEWTIFFFVVVHKKSLSNNKYFEIIWIDFYATTKWQGMIFLCFLWNSIKFILSENKQKNRFFFFFC